MGLRGVAEVQRFALFNQRADPIHLAALGNLGTYTFHHLTAPVFMNHFGNDGCAPGRQFVQCGYIQIGVIAHGQRARDRGCRHHQQMWLERVRLVALGIRAHTGLAAQCQALRHAKAMLLVNDGQRQVLETHLVLNHCVRAHHQLGLAALDHGQSLAPCLGLLAANEPGGGDAERLQPAH